MWCEPQKILITGGTGSLGHALLDQLDGERVSVLSREELKQKQTKQRYAAVRFFLGDVKNFADVDRVISKVKPTVVFHLAAQKHVDIAEENPDECIAVNLLGAQNVAECCHNHGVAYAVFTSTDKAVLPINLYGMCKGAAEKYWLEMNRDSDTHFSVFRWGNVCGSRGSVIHSFARSLKDEGTIRLTDISMTRFWIHLEDVARFMIDNYETAPDDKALIPPMKASPVICLAKAVARHLGVSTFDIDTIGIRRGEKYHECLWSEHDKCLRSDTAEQFTDDELDQLVARVLC